MMGIRFNEDVLVKLIETHFVYYSKAAILKFLIFEQGNFHFHFLLGPANYVGGL